MLKFVYNLSVKLPTGKLKVNPRAGIRRGRQTRFSSATAPGTPAILMQGTLHADNLRITDPSDGPHMSDRMAGKNLAVMTTTSNTTAKSLAKDAVVKRKIGSHGTSQVAYAGKDPREMVKTLRQGTHTFVGKIDEILIPWTRNLRYVTIAPAPSTWADKNFKKFSRLSGFMAMFS